ncbi:carboxylesterase [Ideonella sp. A 288]|uniref:alpha/beta hydrolase n=1 Tax=Ideonella sp. A 288 TaxID=1962181 RepID=UPI000B4B21E1|nr:alpha/beta fold hydrolase [Ideonella sp. A 288]
MTDETLMPGAEPFFFAGNDIGVLVCHGFTGTTQSMRYLGEQLHGAGYTVIGPRLKGHGQTPQAMARTTAQDWIDSVDEALAALRKSCSTIFMTGLSMGGTLTLYTAATHAGVIRGAIPINAVVQIGNPDMAGVAFGHGLPDTVPGIGSDIKKPGITEVAYREVPVPAFRQVYALAAVTHDLLPRVTCPTLVIQSREDHVVQPSNGPRIASGVGSKRVELLWLDDSYHVATLDNDKELIAREAIAFIRSIAGR